MRILELLTERDIPNPKASQCSKPKADLSAVRYSQCVSLGYKAHDSDHTDGTGRQGKKGSGKKLRGKKAKSVRHGGHVKDYSGKP
jgi:hypothetical protein